jgi:hypothetical protein
MEQAPGMGGEVMKLPSEAELIEMERRALLLSGMGLAKRLEAQADTAWEKAEDARSDARVFYQLRAKHRRLRVEQEAIARLPEDIQRLVDAVRQIARERQESKCQSA